MRKLIDLTGQSFGNWKVLQYAGSSYWLCECQCDKHIKKKVYRSSLLSGNSKGCGYCNRGRPRKTNNYDLTHDYGIGFASNTGNKFYFDLEDYNKIKGYCWWENGSGYIQTQSGRKNILLHRIVINPPKELMVDHINHNKHDCRKSNLRIVTNQQNQMNNSTASGVYFDNTKKRWVGNLTITENGKQHRYFKRFKTYEEALDYRKELIKTHFKEYGYYPEKCD